MLKNFFEDLIETDEFNLKVKYVSQNLFVWALLLNRIEIAKIFWQLGYVRYIYIYYFLNPYKFFLHIIKFQIANGLFASILLTNLKKHLPDEAKLDTSSKLVI